MKVLYIVHSGTEYYLKNHIFFIGLVEAEAQQEFFSGDVL